MVVNDLDIERVTRIEAKDQTPWPVDAHGPEPGTVATQFMQSDAAQPPQIVERVGGVQLIRTN